MNCLHQGTNPSPRPRILLICRLRESFPLPRKPESSCPLTKFLCLEPGANVANYEPNASQVAKSEAIFRQPGANVANCEPNASQVAKRIVVRNLEEFYSIVRSPKIPQIISGNYFSHTIGHRTEQVPQREVLIKTPPKGAGFQMAPAVCSLVDVMKRVNYLEPEKRLATKGQAQKR
ncbi:hypothetical protein AVEN_260829-1 [Araneus ventricosus]|uniref:Uncharacterized protein n=1 Tax=Araneus ventricosus TaxID=182803 RepID=A0A4Y2WE42_ARAVE|nr:hypothetical protein AVEN_260829-1 [Araneus ventricosus]